MDHRDTPAMRQFRDVKEKYPGALVFFRMGDFYELFFEDAIEASKALGLTLTKRGKGGLNEVPMCGVPFRAAEQYLAKLIRGGYRVAICDQLEDPRSAKGVVKRGVTRVVSPGAVLDAHLLDADRPNYLGAWIQDGARAALAWLDVSTGEFLAAEGAPGAIAERAAARPVSELVVVEEVAPPPWAQGLPIHPVAAFWQQPAETADALKRQFGLERLDGLGFGDAHLALRASGMLLRQALELQPGGAPQTGFPRLLADGLALRVDPFTLRNLEVFDPLHGSASDGTLYTAAKRTRTPMGARLLRARLAEPTRDLAVLGARLDAADWMAAHPDLCRALAPILGAAGDVERLATRLQLGCITPPECHALAAGADALVDALAVCAAHGGAPAELFPEEAWPLEKLAAFVRGAVQPDPPSHLREGGVMAAGHDTELDRLRTVKNDAGSLLSALEQRERARTGIHNLRIRYNKVFGYFIEISKSQLGSVPEDYERRQTVTTGERFTTPDVRKLEEDILTAEERILALEQQLYASLLKELGRSVPALRAAAHWLARIDVAVSTAVLGAEQGWTRPAFSADGSFSVRQGRHPVVERLARDPFVPNDCRMGPGRRVLLITGPNMGGKSTFLRQNALMLLLAQAGLYVPAAEALLPVCDQLFSRVGASDDLARGMSTFMMEMVETAHILNTATTDSFLILDEVGRGTSTHDGMALAWAILEQLALEGKSRPLTLFATHYHELTGLADHLPDLDNLSMAVRETQGRVHFLHRVEDGPADRSYGIHVAQLAGVPRPVVARAREILAVLEETAVDVQERLESLLRTHHAAQPNLFAGTGPARPQRGKPAPPPAPEETHPVVADLLAADPDRMTPLEALNFLALLKRKAEGP